jgi:hypothetical protein
MSKIPETREELRKMVMEGLEGGASQLIKDSVYMESLIDLVHIEVRKTVHENPEGVSNRMLNRAIFPVLLKLVSIKGLEVTLSEIRSYNSQHFNVQGVLCLGDLLKANAEHVLKGFNSESGENEFRKLYHIHMMISSLCIIYEGLKDEIAEDGIDKVAGAIMRLYEKATEDMINRTEDRL